jgi:hypothetical protein
VVGKILDRYNFGFGAQSGESTLPSNDSQLCTGSTLTASPAARPGLSSAVFLIREITRRRKW